MFLMNICIFKYINDYLPNELHIYTIKQSVYASMNYKQTKNKCQEIILKYLKMTGSSEACCGFNKTKDLFLFGGTPELNMQAVCVENISVCNWIFLEAIQTCTIDMTFAFAITLQLMGKGEYLVHHLSFHNTFFLLFSRKHKYKIDVHIAF